jgi:hypothetical protein
MVKVRVVIPLIKLNTMKLNQSKHTPLRQGNVLVHSLTVHWRW